MRECTLYSYTTHMICLHSTSPNWMKFCVQEKSSAWVYCKKSQEWHWKSKQWMQEYSTVMYLFFRSIHEVLIVAEKKTTRLQHGLWIVLYKIAWLCNTVSTRKSLLGDSQMNTTIDSNRQLFLILRNSQIATTVRLCWEAMFFFIVGISDISVFTFFNTFSSCSIALAGLDRNLLQTH